MKIRSRAVRLGAGLAALAMAATVAVPAASAAPQAPADVRAEMQQLLGALRQENSAPGVAFTFGDGTDDTTLSSGTADILANRPIRSTDKVRVGSDTKMFVAAVALQLAGEGLLDLDVPVDQYLPGVLRYPADKAPADPAAYDGRTVTLRQLLQHTAGLGDYGADLLYVLNPLHQILPPQPRDLVAHGLRTGPVALPGTTWAYSNTGYALVGMAVEAATGRSLGTEIRERIVEPLGLSNTFFAGRGQRTLPGSHVRGYLTALIPLDMTNFEPAVWGAAGALVSSADDMNTFMSALLAGEVLPPALLAQMQDHFPTPTGGYGLGLVRVPLSCGEAWGHGGYVAGYRTLGLAMANGRHGFYTMNSSIAFNLTPPGVPTNTYDLFELTLC